MQYTHKKRSKDTGRMLGMETDRHYTAESQGVLRVSYNHWKLERHETCTPLRPQGIHLPHALTSDF